MTRLVVLFTLACALSARADIPPPDVSGCNGKVAGDACKRDDASDGVCKASTCSRNDYSDGPPPKQVQYECVVCAAGAPEKKSASCAAVPGVGVVLAVMVLGRRRRF
jgi:hypothetical protein